MPEEAAKRLTGARMAPERRGLAFRGSFSHDQLAKRRERASVVSVERIADSGHLRGPQPRRQIDPVYRQTSWVWATHRGSERKSGPRREKI